MYTLLGATGALLRLLFATTLRLAYGIRILGATDPWRPLKRGGRGTSITPFTISNYIEQLNI